jgi:hypothetical protein
MNPIMRAVALGAALLMSGPAFAEKYPDKPVKIIIRSRRAASPTLPAG